MTSNSCQRKPHLGTVEEEVPMSRINLAVIMANGANGLRAQGYALRNATGKSINCISKCGTNDKKLFSIYSFVWFFFCFFLFKFKGGVENLASVVAT